MSHNPEELELINRGPGAVQPVHTATPGGDRHRRKAINQGVRMLYSNTRKNKIGSIIEGERNACNANEIVTAWRRADPGPEHRAQKLKLNSFIGGRKSVSLKTIAVSTASRRSCSAGLLITRPSASWAASRRRHFKTVLLGPQGRRGRTNLSNAMKKYPRPERITSA
jgi:hypothetical protein